MAWEEKPLASAHRVGLRRMSADRRGLRKTQEQHLTEVRTPDAASFALSTAAFSVVFSASSFDSSSLVIPSSVIRMNAGVDMPSVFEARLAELGMQEMAQKFRTKGWGTYANFANAMTKGPGEFDEEAFMDKVVVVVAGSRESPYFAALLRLHTEAYTLMMADLEERTKARNQNHQVQLIGLPDVERKRRIQELRKKLAPGFKLADEHEPAVWVIDKLQDFYDRGTFEYLDWETIGRRDHERATVSKTKKWVAGPSGAIVEQTVTNPTKASHGSDLSLLQLLRRRGVALDVTKWVSFDMHEVMVRVV